MAPSIDPAGSPAEQPPGPEHNQDGTDTANHPDQPGVAGQLSLLEQDETWQAYVTGLQARADAGDIAAIAALAELPRRAPLISRIWEITRLPFRRRTDQD